MAGAAETAPNTDMANTPSPPLYLAGLVISFCGLIAADAALSQPDWGWLERICLLTGLGFLFSYGSRQMGIKPQGIIFGFFVVLLLILAGFATGQVVLDQFLPYGADTSELHIVSILAWGATLGAWALCSDNAVMGTAIPAMAILGLSASQDLNNPILICFAVFIPTVLFLLIHQNYLHHRARASEAARAAKAPRLLLAQFAQAGLCALAVLLAGLVVIVPAQAVFAHLSLAQAIRRLAAYKPDGSSSTTKTFSDDDNLQIGTGAAWSASAEVVMQVTSSDGQEHYWRGRTYDEYTGAGWQSSLENKTELLSAVPADADHAGYALQSDFMPGDTSPSPSLPVLTATFHVIGNTSQFYYASNPKALIVPAQAVRGDVSFCRDGRLNLAAQGVRFPYAVVSSPLPDAMDPAVQERLRQGGTDYPAEVRQLYLDPKGAGITQTDDMAFFRQALAEAVASLPPDRRDPLDEALALRAWVSQRCVYSLVPPPIPDEADHVRYFLNDSRRGYCDMFASSLAVLCRTAGIPARLATGFAPGDPQGGSFNLRAEDKHAWTEVYFPHTGWVILDATAGSRTDGSVPNAPGPKHGLLGGLHFRWNAGNALISILIGLILLIVAYVLKTEVYRPVAGETETTNAAGRPASCAANCVGTVVCAFDPCAGPAWPAALPFGNTRRICRPRQSITHRGRTRVRRFSVAAPRHFFKPRHSPALVTPGQIRCRRGSGTGPPKSLSLNRRRGRRPGGGCGDGCFTRCRLRQELLEANTKLMELDYSKLAKGFPKPIERVYLFMGSDDALKREALLKLTKPLIDQSFADFDCEERDVPPTGQGEPGETARAILASAAGVPMASERRVVIVTNVHRLGKEDQDVLALGLPKLGDLSCLVLIAGATEYDAGKVKGKTLGDKTAERPRQSRRDCAVRRPQ